MGSRVIVIDNGSSDGSADWLSGQPGLEVIVNKSNLGCAVAWNQGVNLASGFDNSIVGNPSSSNWMIFLNNDVLLPPGWLNSLLAAADYHFLDVISPAMRESALDYPFPAYAESFMQNLRGSIRRDVAHGVCFAVRGRVFHTIGGFDENFKIGQFEDEDFFRRARLAGFRIGTVGDCFIHHFGSVTQNALSTPSRERPYEAANRFYFRKKWHLSWHRRRFDSLFSAVRRFYWRYSERLVYGHTLHEKWSCGRLRRL